MSAKELVFEGDARAHALAGAQALASAVGVTLGPRGRNVIIEKSWGAPKVTKDGVTVAKEIELPDRFENMGAQVIREAAARTADEAGDGTTTATVLAEAVLREGTRLVAAGHDPAGLKRGIDAATRAVARRLGELSRPVSGTDEVAKVGTLSANGDETIGRLLADALDRVGLDGVITIEEGKGRETTLEVVEGMQLDRGYLSSYFVTDPERMEAVLEDAYVLLHDKKLSSMAALVPLLERVARSGRPLLVVAEDVEGEALATLVVNRLRGTMTCCAVKAPGFGDRRKEMLTDLATLTGGTVVSAETGMDLETVGLEVLGRAGRVTVTKDHTTVVHGAGDRAAIDGRVATIRAQIDETTSDYDREKLQERLAKLAGGVAVIEVGAATEVEMKERKDRVDDAMHATRAAVEEGIVPGGGVALVRAQSAVDALTLEGAEAVGASIVRRALEEPLRRIVRNAGGDGSVVVDRVRAGEAGFGYDAATGELRDLYEAGVIDPTKVVRAAVRNA